MADELNRMFYEQVESLYIEDCTSAVPIADCDIANVMTQIMTDVHRQWLTELKSQWTPFVEDAKAMVESHGLDSYNLLPVVFGNIRKNNASIFQQRQQEILDIINMDTVADVMDACVLNEPGLLDNLTDYNSAEDSDYIPDEEDESSSNSE